MRSAMRRGVLVCLLIGAAGVGPASRAAELAVEAPDGCLDPTTLADEVSDLIGKPLASVADVDFRIRITERPPHGWRLRLETLDPRGASGDAPTVRGSREIDGASCAELSEAASVAIAVSVRSLAGAAEAPPPPPPPHPTSTVSAPTPQLTRAGSPKPAWHPALALALATDTGALPSTTPGVELEGDLQRGALRLALLATWFASQDAAGADNVGGGTFQLALGGALACYAPRWGRWTPLACGGGELGRLAGTGLDVARPETGSTFWRAARAEAGATAAVGANTAILLRSGIAVPLARPAFVLDQSQFVYRPSRVTLRLTAGFELGF
jgi:hypothetical protein